MVVCYHVSLSHSCARPAGDAALLSAACEQCVHRASTFTHSITLPQQECTQERVHTLQLGFNEHQATKQTLAQDICCYRRFTTTTIDTRHNMALTSAASPRRLWLHQCHNTAGAGERKSAARPNKNNLTDCSSSTQPQAGVCCTQEPPPPPLLVAAAPPPGPAPTAS